MRAGMMTVDELIHIANTEHWKRGGSDTWETIHERHGLPNSPEATRKRVQRAEAKRSKRNGHAPPPASKIVPDKRKTLEETIAAAIADYVEDSLQDTEELEPVPPPRPASTDDTEAWQQWKEEHPEVTALFLYDTHIPDHDEQALRLVTKLIPVIKPDLIISGGDGLDFPSFSNFQSTERPRMVDAFQEIRPVWDELIDALTEAAPEAVIVAIAGNHEARLFKFMSENWQLYDTLQGVFAELMQSQGRVWWLGGAQQTSIGDLLIKHGRRYGINAARINLDKIGGGASVIQGHSHTPSLVVKKVLRADGTYQVLYSAVAPCLCNIPPWYDDSAGETWLQGVTVGHVNEENVTLQNVVYWPTRNGGLGCRYGGEKVEVS